MPLRPSGKGDLIREDLPLTGAIHAPYPQFLRDPMKAVASPKVRVVVYRCHFCQMGAVTLDRLYPIDTGKLAQGYPPKGGHDARAQT